MSAASKARSLALYLSFARSLSLARSFSISRSQSTQECANRDESIHVPVSTLHDASHITCAVVGAHARVRAASSFS